MAPLVQIWMFYMADFIGSTWQYGEGHQPMDVEVLQQVVSEVPTVWFQSYRLPCRRYFNPNGLAAIANEQCIIQ